MEADFERGDELATAGDRVALEYGWWASEWIRAEAYRAGEKGGLPIGPQVGVYPDSRADPDSRAAFSYGLTVLEKRHGKYLSKTQITDRIRVGRAFPPGEYKDLQDELPRYHLTFSILRAAYVKDDKQATLDLLLWAAENDAAPLQIYARKTGMVIESEEAKAWRHMVEWSGKYTDRCEDTKTERYGLAQSVLAHDRKERCQK
jgi:hypothetical protein